MNTRDLGIGAGKGDKSRVTSVEVFRERFPSNMGPKRTHYRSACCEAPYTFVGAAWQRIDGTVWFKCMACQKPCNPRAFEIT